MKGSNFSYLLKQGLVSVWHNRLMSFAGFCILMVSLLLVGVSVLFALDIGIIIGNIEDTNEIVVFVYNETEESELSHISDVLNNYSYVDTVSYISPDQALEITRGSYGLDGIEELFDRMGESPLPHSYVVSLNDITKINEAAAAFARISGVEDVRAPYDFASFLISIRTTFTVIGSAVLLALIVVCLVIIYNTARTSVFARRMQISIMKHVGATNSFIKFPFFIEGMFIGIVAGVASWFLTKLAYESVVHLFMEDIQILEVLGLRNIIDFREITWYVLAANCLAGALIGAVGTVFSMGKHLKV